MARTMALHASLQTTCFITSLGDKARPVALVALQGFAAFLAVRLHHGQAAYSSHYSIKRLYGTNLFRRPAVSVLRLSGPSGGGRSRPPVG
jgi:hypothetical protein